MKVLDIIQSESKLSELTHIDHLVLRVNQLEKQIDFYQKVLKMKLHYSNQNEAHLGSETDVLLKLIKKGSYLRRHQETGLYHFALLYPNEESLAFALKHLDQLNVHHSPTDHGYSKTTYLEDVEGNVIELYIRTVDRAIYVQEGSEIYVKYSNGTIGSGRDPLDLNELYAHAQNKQSFTILPKLTQVGHLHFYAVDLEKNNQFYQEILGYAKGIDYQSFRMRDVALSFQQNHVIAFNTWKGVNIPLQKEDSLGIDAYTIVVTQQNLSEIKQRMLKANYAFQEEEDSLQVYDPSNMKIILKTN